MKRLLSLLMLAAIAVRADEAFQPANILATLEKVADWQIANPSKHETTDWTQGAWYNGMMALDGISASPRFREAMVRIGETNEWKTGKRPYHADDHCVGQMYCELYQLYREPKMLAGLQERFDWLLKNPYTAPLSPEKPKKAEGVPGGAMRWWWCDALFMGPPAWARLYEVTGDKRYRDFMVKEWKATSDYLYDKEEHLYFRDASYFDKREANGKKIFWSRGNGWVMGGLVRVLQVLPQNDPDRPFFVQQFREMSERLVTLQQGDGLWRSSLLDPDSYPLKEASGSGFHAFALAWGVNQGLLPANKYQPAVERGWAGLIGCVAADGKLTHVQPIGADPKKFDEGSTEVYGVGAFLLAGTEIWRLSLLSGVQKIEQAAVNDAKVLRPQETVEIDWSIVASKLPAATPENLAVMDAQRSRIVDSQIVDADADGKPEQLLVQGDFLPGQRHEYILVAGLPRAQQPKPQLVTFGRFVPERFDDFAWENDRIAHRVYGPALMTAPKETGGSGIDVWCKSVRYPILDKWYKSGEYHKDHGEGVDAYKVGLARGCGGVGLLLGGKIAYGMDFTTWKILANGPIRTTVRFEYAPWKAGGQTITETKTISLDRGANLNRIVSTLTSDAGGELPVVVGLTKRPGDGEVTQEDNPGWLVYTEPEHKPDGKTHLALVAAPGVRPVVDEQVGHYTMLLKTPSGQPVTYFAGAGWSKGLDYPDHLSFAEYVKTAAARLAAPIRVE